MKILQLLLLLVISLFAKYPLNEGLYINELDDVVIEIRNSVDKSYFTFIRSEYPKPDNKIEVLNKDEKVYLIFNYNDDEKNVNFTKTAVIENIDSFFMKDEVNQNDVKYSRITSLEAFEVLLKNVKSIEKYNNFPINSLQNQFRMSIENIEIYSNIAHYFYEINGYQQAMEILVDILEYFTNRTKDHYKLAKSMEKLLDKKDIYYINETSIDKHYLSYIAQMLYDKRDSEIPKELMYRYSKYIDILIELNNLQKEKYQVLDITQGDLNKDGLDDISLVIETVEPNKIEIGNYYFYSSNINERVWIVFLNSNDKYELIAKNSSLIYSNESTNCDDSFDNIEIKKESLFLYTHYWCSSSSWGEGNKRYQFIYRNNKLILAGTEEFHDSGVDGTGEMISTNYLTKKQIIQQTIYHGDPEGKPKIVTLELKTPIEFNDAKE